MAASGAERIAALRARRRAEGRCIDCGMNISRYVRCADCRALQADAAAERRALRTAERDGAAQARLDKLDRMEAAYKRAGPPADRGLALPPGAPDRADRRITLTGDVPVHVVSSQVS